MSVAHPARLVVGGGSTFAMRARASSGVAGTGATETGGSGAGAAQPASTRTALVSSDRTAPGMSRAESVLSVEPAELLHALPGVHFGRVDVPLPVDCDVVDDVELPCETSG